ncbi:Glu-tRNA(Gln) amidotransferase subunit GatE [Candidatus Fermentibacterales bacterium]|nr:Glu-tRNA(Gln) amidotransferase subunit GatE [Candidatus Fermentibacterales bacterium]
MPGSTRHAGPEADPGSGTARLGDDDYYREIGLISGLEVHQQLLTDHKMFCRCPAGHYTTTHDGSVLRHMRPTLSELGSYDGTALMEFKTRKNIVYLLHKDNVCTYEMDDTPPFLVNDKAIDVAIEQCLMLGCDIVDEVHIARKQYLDGSIPTGFQRTAIVGVDGKLPFRGRELSITQVSVEEDSCREVSDRGHLIVWRTDRLGMPLIETVTGPDLRTPDEVAEAILLVGRVCRSTGHVRVGIGASRQDVNVSVRGGRRVEIKGVPQAGWAPLLVHAEAVRQVRLLELRDHLAERGFRQPDDLIIDHEDVTDLFARSALEYLHAQAWDEFVRLDGRRKDLELGLGPFCVRAVRLRGLRDTLSWPTQPGRQFVDELKGRIRVIACLDQQPILLHSEAWPAYEGCDAELGDLVKRLGAGPDDSLIVVWGPEQDTITAAQEVGIRYADALDGIPNETRQPFPDGSTDFERILPGPDRMYPDTDSPPQAITRDRVDGLRQGLPDPPWVREERYAEAGLPRDTIHYLIRRGGSRLVDLVAPREDDGDLRWAGFLFGERLKGLRRSGVSPAGIGDSAWLDLFGFLREHPEAREAWRELVEMMAANPHASPRDIARDMGLGSAPGGWEKTLARLANGESPDHPDGTRGQAHRFLMGRAMRTLRGRVPASEVSGLLWQELKEKR